MDLKVRQLRRFKIWWLVLTVLIGLIGVVSPF